MNWCVKILTDEDGYEIFEPKWHLAVELDAPRTLCEGQTFTNGESAVEYEEKHTKRGGITCRKCLIAIREIKSVKL